MKIVATIQARMGSGRLPGKTLLPLINKPMLALQIERIQRSALIDQIVVATSVKKQDDPIESLAVGLGVGCFRGSEDDVLGRVTGALKASSAELHVAFCADSPLPDPHVIDAVIGVYLKQEGKSDYVANYMKQTYPSGLEVIVYDPHILYDIERTVMEPEEREHVSVHIERRPDRYRLMNVEAPTHQRRPDLYLEVDTQEDYLMMSSLTTALAEQNPRFSLNDIISFTDAHPELVRMNQDVPRRWRAFRRVGAASV